MFLFFYKDIYRQFIALTSQSDYKIMWNVSDSLLLLLFVKIVTPSIDLMFYSFWGILILRNHSGWLGDSFFTQDWNLHLNLIIAHGCFQTSIFQLLHAFTEQRITHSAQQSIKKWWHLPVCLLRKWKKKKMKVQVKVNDTLTQCFFFYFFQIFQ